MKSKPKEKIIPGLPYNSDIYDLGEAARLTIYELSFLLLIRSFMNKGNRESWPSLTLIGKRIRISRRQATRVAASLTEKGIITIEGRKSYHKSGAKYNNRYRFIYPWTCTCIDSQSIPVVTDSPHLHRLTAPPVVTDRHLIEQEKEQGNKQSRHQGKNDDDSSISSISKNKPDQRESSQNRKGSSNSKQRKKAGGKSGKGKKNRHVSLEKFYNTVPDEVDLSHPAYSGKRYDLRKYIAPFVGNSKMLVKIHGTDFSDKKPKWWQDAFCEFYETAICYHWSKDSYEKPGNGFKTAFHRACVSGVMSHFGFDPKTPKQIKHEQAEKKAEQDRLDRADKKRKAVEEKKKKAKDRKKAKLQKVWDDLEKDDYTGQCLHCGVRDLDSLEFHIKECLKNGTVKKETFTDDLRTSIQNEFRY